MTRPAPLFAPLGDSAITLRFGESISAELSRDVAHAMQLLAAERIDDVVEIVPSYAALAVFYDSLAVGYDEMRQRIGDALEQPDGVGEEIASQTRDALLISVRYDGEDLDDVCRRTNLTRDDVIDLHSNREYRVQVIGFVPGFAYLGTLDERLALPRRESPRSRVAAGSVGIADLQTGIYPSATPGGWNIIGTTDLVLFNPHRTSPALLRVGDTVRFEPVAG